MVFDCNNFIFGIRLRECGLFESGRLPDPSLMVLPRNAGNRRTPDSSPYLLVTSAKYVGMVDTTLLSVDVISLLAISLTSSDVCSVGVEPTWGLLATRVVPLKKFRLGFTTFNCDGRSNRRVVFVCPSSFDSVDGGAAVF